MPFSIGMLQFSGNSLIIVPIVNSFSVFLQSDGYSAVSFSGSSFEDMNASFNLSPTEKSLSAVLSKCILSLSCFFIKSVLSVYSEAVDSIFSIAYPISFGAITITSFPESMAASFGAPLSAYFASISIPA